MEKEIFGDAAVDEGIAVDLKEGLEHPQAKGQAGGKRGQHSESGEEGPIPTGGRRRYWRQLTLRSGFHTIRNV